MSCIVLVRCVLVLRCGLAGVVWYPDASSGACDLFVGLFHELYCSSTMCVGITLWFGWGGVVSGCRLQPLGSAW
jgi:hypothetical protein